MRTIAVLAALAASASVHAQTVIYDTFNEADQANLFDCCNVVALPSHQQRIAIPFTPSADARVDEIDLALSSSGGSQPRWYVRLMTDTAKGLPGKSRHHFQVRDIPAGGQCCAFVAAALRDEAPGISVHAGVTYWIEVNTEGDDFGGWNLNTLDLSGDYAAQQDPASGWAITSGPLPAVRVLGK